MGIKPCHALRCDSWEVSHSQGRPRTQTRWETGLNGERKKNLKVGRGERMAMGGIEGINIFKMHCMKFS